MKTLITILILVVTAAAQQEPLAVVGIGQSNMVGVGLPAAPSDITPIDGVIIWNHPQLEFQTWDLNANPPQAQHGIPGRNNMLFQFAKKTHLATGRNVVVIMESEGGRPITDWEFPGRVHADGLIAQINTSGIPQIHAVVFHQGETDRSGGPESYRTKFTNMVTTVLRPLPQIPHDTPIICGTLANNATYYNGSVIPGYDHMNRFFYDIQARGLPADRFVLVANFDRLKTLSDTLHFDGPSLTQAGRLIFDVWMNSRSTPVRQWRTSVLEVDPDTGRDDIAISDRSRVLWDISGSSVRQFDRSLPFKSLTAAQAAARTGETIE